MTDLKQVFAIAGYQKRFVCPGAEPFKAEQRSSHINFAATGRKDHVL
jgi:hypothetical protein